MKTAKLTLMFLACAAAIPAFAQNTTDSRCGSTNYDSSRNIFTIANPSPGTASQQCFITVVPKASWTGGSPNLASSQFVEGNYEIALSGGGGGGGGGGPGGDEQRRHHHAGGGGDGGNGGGAAAAVTTVRYLNPGVYRMTIGSGGQGGASNGGHGGDGAPSSLSNAYSGETVAGFSGSETWDGTYNNGKGLMAYYAGTPAKSGPRGADGSSGTATGKSSAGDSGQNGGNGFIKLALKDPVPQAAPAASSAIATTPAPAAMRPAKKDRN